MLRFCKRILARSVEPDRDWKHGGRSSSRTRQSVKRTIVAYCDIQHSTNDIEAGAPCNCIWWINIRFQPTLPSSRNLLCECRTLIISQREAVGFSCVRPSLLLQGWHGNLDVCLPLMAFGQVSCSDTSRVETETSSCFFGTYHWKVLHDLQGQTEFESFLLKSQIIIITRANY